MTDILLIDSQPARAQGLAAALREHGIQTTALDALPPLETLSGHACLVALDDLVERNLNKAAAAIPTIVLAQAATIPSAVATIRRGAVDYLELPVDTQTLLAAIERASSAAPTAKTDAIDHFPMIGSSVQMRQLKEGIAKVAPTDSTVLILGQSGTGKELVARALHAASHRASAPLISLNCATIPANLVEAELFGLEQYESDQGSHRGLIEAAEGGTLFLDEIAELPAAAQARLLRVLQGENRRVGSSATEPVNVRIIAATHRNLAELTEQGHFREDLFYRLNVLCFELPALKDRAGDILEIADWLLKRTASRLNKDGLSFADDALDAMSRYHWPGNVRELENAVERAVILADSHSYLNQTLLAIQPASSATFEKELAADGDQTSLEDYFVRFVLDHQDQFTETELAEKLGISRKSLWERRQRLNIPRRKTRKRGPRRDASGA